MRAAEQRTYATQCLQQAIKGDFQQAARIRQQIYALNTPGTIGIDWRDWNGIWQMDNKYLTFLNNEDFSDLQNSAEYIHLFKSGIFVDRLWGFRDCWAINQIMKFTNEKFYSPLLERFLTSKKICFDSITREFIYEKTKMRNITAKQYYARWREYGYTPKLQPIIYNYGEYDLGFYERPTAKQINSMRIEYYNFDLYDKMSCVNIDKFPKTYQTFQKHKKAKSEKYLNWIQQYHIWLQRFDTENYIHTKWGIYEKPILYKIKFDYGARNDAKKVF